VPAAGERDRLGGPRRTLARLRFAWQAARRVRELDREERFDVVVAPELFAPGLFLALSMPERLVTRLHTPTEIGERFNRPGGAGLAHRLAALPERWQARRSRGLSAATPLLRDAVARAWNLAPERIRVIPNGVPVERVRELAERQAREVEADYLLYFGRLERRKGVHRLTAALGPVLARHPALRALYVGRDWGLGGEIRTSPAARSGRLTLVDTLARPRLFGLVHHARLVVLPSLFENAPNAALEAMALGRPVLATRGTGFDELIEDGVSGFLVEPDDADALERGLEAALARSDLEAVGERGLASVRRFDALTVARRQAEYFRAAVG
jgi:glycosyltransferase involved in cell wall biosynthesis